ncbi:MAG: hypothetical protein OEU92_22485, partial [Alphaproteobacteria bacterium]|nr:hypothetical protein [Alphaproteobacteria bacterium]
MDPALIALISAIITAAVTVTITWLQINHQRYLARVNIRKDAALNYNKIANERNAKKFDHHMGILQEIHIALAQIGFDYSTSGEYIRAFSASDLNIHHENYVQNIRSLEKIKAAVDINYPNRNCSPPLGLVG